MSVAPLPDGWSVLEDSAAPSLPEGWALAGETPPGLPAGWSEAQPFDRAALDAQAPKQPTEFDPGTAYYGDATDLGHNVDPKVFTAPSITLPRMPDLSGLRLPELPMSSQDFGPQPTPSPAAMAGLYNAAAPAVEGLTSPQNLLLAAGTAGLGTAALEGSLGAKAALAGVGATFGGVMAVDTVEAVKHAREVLANPVATTQQKIEAVATPAVTGAMSLAALLGVGRMAAGEAIPRINAAYPEVFWKKAGLSAEQFAQDYPATVRRVAGVDGATPTPADIALVQRVNDAAKAAGVKVGDLARGRVVAEQIEWAPRAVQRIMPESLRPAVPAGGGLQFRAVDGTPMAAPAPAAPQAPAPTPGPAGERALLTPAAVDPVQAPKSAIVSAPETPAPTAAAPLAPVQVAPPESLPTPAVNAPAAGTLFDPPPSTTAISPAAHPVVEFPVADIQVNKDIRQFKGEADSATGVVDALAGKFERLGTAPIVLWQKASGETEVITGRHRLDLARRSGETTIPAQVVRESDGFTQQMALTFDAESNIRDGQGTVKDYAHYFRNSPGLLPADADARGLRARAKGAAGWALGRDASDDLYTGYANGQITEAKAVAIASGAPGRPDAQASAMRQAKAMTAAELNFYAKNLARLSGAAAGGGGEQMGFGGIAVDFANFEAQAAKIAAVQAERLRQNNDLILAAQGAAKRPEAARKMGLPVDNPLELNRRIGELKKANLALQNPDAATYAELAHAAGIKIAAPDAPAEAPPVAFDPNQIDMFGGEPPSAPPTALDRFNGGALLPPAEKLDLPVQNQAPGGDMFGRGPLPEVDDGNPFDPADPIDPAMPPLPPGTPAARLNSGRMLSPMERTAPGTKTIDIAAVHESLLEVIRAAGGESAIREGRFFQKARGIAKQHEETIRVDSLINLPTVVHEIGHVLAKRVFGSMLSRSMIRGIGNGAVVKELQGLGKALYGSRTPTAGYTAEGFSEFIRLWVSTEDAARLAPTATTWFEQTWMRDNPEIAFALRSARDAMDLWRGQGAEGRVRAQQKADPTRWQRVRDAVRKSLSRRQLVEESAPLEALAATVERKIKGKLLPGSNPALVFQSVRQTAGAMLETMVERGVVDANGRVIAPPLREAYAALRPADAENFRDYLVMLQVIERFKQGHKSTGFNVEDAVYLRDKLGADPRFVTAAEKVAQWNSDVLKYWRDAFPEQNTALYNAIVKRNPKYYTPLARVLDPAKVKPGTATQGSSNLSRFKGSSLPVKQAIEQTLKGAESLIARAHRDMVMRVVVAIAKMPGMGFVLEPVPRQRVVETLNVEKIRSQLEAMGVDTTAIPPDEMLSYAAQLDAPTGTDPIISLNINGQTQWFQTLPDVYEVLAGVQEPARLGLAFEALAGGPSRLFRLGTTGLRAGFSLFTNPARDFQTFQLQSIYGNPATRTAAYFAALRDIVWAGLSGKESPALQLVSQLGLQSSTFIGGDIAQIQRTAKGLFRHNKLTRTVLTPIESMRELLSFTETAPRLAEFMLALDESGWKPGQPLSVNQVVALRLAFKRVTTDFSAKGAGWDVVRRAVPFSNANVQGTRAMLRATRTDQGPRDQAKAWAKFVLNGVALLTVPSIMEYLANKDEDWYNALPWKERFLYFNIKMGNQVVQIPKPMEWGLAFTVLPTALLDSLNKQDPRAFKEALGHSFDVANPLTLPVLPKAYIEQKQNRIDFFNRPIVPRAELDLRPGSQVGRYTSALGKALGEAFPETVSPRRFDAAVRGVLGGLGGDLLDGPEAVMRSLGLATSNDREWEPADMFVVGKAFRRGGPVTANNRHLFEFWDDLNRYRAMSASYSHALKQRAEEEARTGTASTPIPKDITARDRLYAALLEGRYVEIKARIDVAERSKETVVRQKLYSRAGELARSALTLRPKD